MQKDVKETFLISTCVLLGFLVILSLFSKDPYPESYAPNEVKAFGLMEEVRKKDQANMVGLQAERCVEMLIKDCPMAIVSAYSLGPRVLAYYCYRACEGGLAFSETLNKPHIVYKQKTLQYSSAREIKGLISHELAHHVFEVGSGNRSFKKICENYKGAGCNDHPEEDTENLLIFN